MINGTKETLATPKLLNPADFIVVTIILLVRTDLIDPIVYGP